MQSFLVILALATFIALFFMTIEFIFGFKKIKNLANQPIIESKSLPFVSVILSVLNEEKDIENVVTSLSNLKYPNLEIIVVNDRSTDNTPDILNQLELKYSNLQVYHIYELPNGWFGKNHALYLASQCAYGEWLLFTDADVQMKSDALCKAMSYTLQNELDHLTIHELHYA